MMMCFFCICIILLCRLNLQKENKKDMKSIIIKSIFPALVVAHIIVRFAMVDAVEIRTSNGIDRSDRVSVLTAEMESQTDYIKEHEHEAAAIVLASAN